MAIKRSEVESLAQELGAIRERVTDIQQKFSERRDEASERWLESERGQACEQVVDALEELDDQLDTAIGAMNDYMEA